MMPSPLLLTVLLLLLALPLLLLEALASEASADAASSSDQTSSASVTASITVPTPPPGRSPLLMLSTMDGTVSAFDAQTGSLVFTYRDSRPAVQSWAVPGLPEYVPSPDGLLYRIDHDTDEAHVVEGKFISRNTASNLNAALPPAARLSADAVILTNEESSVLFIDLRTGRVVRETRFADTSPPSDPFLPALSDTVVVIQRTAVGVRILETSSGRELANATLVHTEPRFWHHGRCLTPANPAADRFVAYTTESRDRVFVRNLRTGDVIWSKSVAVPVVEAHGLGGVRIVASQREADAIAAQTTHSGDAELSGTFKLALPHTEPLMGDPLDRDIVVRENGKYVYAVRAPPRQPGAAEDVGAARGGRRLPHGSLGHDPSSMRRAVRRYSVANVNDLSALGPTDRVLGLSRVPAKATPGQDPLTADAALVLTSREAGLSAVVLVLVGVVGYLAGSRPRSSEVDPDAVKQDGRIVRRRRRTNASRSGTGDDTDHDTQDDNPAQSLDAAHRALLHDGLLSKDTNPSLKAEMIALAGSGATLTAEHGALLESSTGSTGSGSGGFISNRSESGWMTVGCLQVSSKVLGVGSHGTVVYEGRMVPGSRMVAVKRLLRQFFESARKEISLLVQLDEASPHVVRYFAMEEDSEFIYLALELCASSLAECITERLPPVPPAEYTKGPPPTYTSRALRQLLQGLSDLHRVGVVHRDVKPQNVLITRVSAGVGDMKLADVGLALRLAANRSSYTAVTNPGGGVGTTGWRAPEVLSGGRQTKSVDIFAVGCVICSVLTGGEHPFGNAIFGRDGNIAAGSPNLKPLENLCLPEATDIVEKMISADPSARPTAENALKHPFFWTDATKLSFLVDISDRLYDLRHDTIRYTENLDRYRLARKYCTDWLVLMDMDLLSSLGRGYENSASGLLRVIRNKRNHYSELSASLRRRLGPLPEDRDKNINDGDTKAQITGDDEQSKCNNFLTYFTKRVPNLLMTVYQYALENPALIGQPHFTRYGLKTDQYKEPASSNYVARKLRDGRWDADRTGGFWRVPEPIQNEEQPDTRQSSSTGSGDSGRKMYHRHELVNLQQRCTELGMDVKRKLILAEIFDADVIDRYKTRLVTIDTNDDDTEAADPDDSESPADAGTPPGFQKVLPKRGSQHNSGFANRTTVSYAAIASSPARATFSHVGGSTYQGTSASAPQNTRRTPGTGHSPKTHTLNGEERVVDFGALRRKDHT